VPWPESNLEEVLPEESLELPEALSDSPATLTSTTGGFAGRRWSASGNRPTSALSGLALMAKPRQGDRDSGRYYSLTEPLGALLRLGAELIPFRAVTTGGGVGIRLPL
jgi:hypothetical protein